MYFFNLTLACSDDWEKARVSESNLVPTIARVNAGGMKKSGSVAGSFTSGHSFKAGLDMLKQGLKVL